MIENSLLRGHTLHYVPDDIQRRVELRLLGKKANRCAFGQPCFARKFLVKPGHDAKQRRLARAVRSEDADLGVWIKRQIVVFQDFLAAGIGLGQAMHMVDELARHLLSGRIVDWSRVF